MASGDFVDASTGSFFNLLLDGVATGATNDGVWIDCGEYDCGTVVVLGPATTTVVTVNAHNGVLVGTDMTKPAAAVVGAVVQTGAAGTSFVTSLAVLPKYLKCAITATGTGTVTAVLYARAY